MIDNHPVIDIAMNTRAKPSERLCGDWVFSYQQQDKILLICMDVLGHGPKAYANGKLAIKQLEQQLNDNSDISPSSILYILDKVLPSDRGAAVSICTINLQTMEMAFAGVGNVSARRLFPTTQSLVNRDGVVGSNMRTPHTTTLKLQPKDIFLIHTDGIKTRFNFQDYPQMISHNAETAVQSILTQFSKEHDDAGCIVLKVAEQPRHWSRP